MSTPLNTLFNKTEVKNIQEMFPITEVITLGDIKVCNNSRLKYSIHTDAAGLAAETFAITQDFNQFVEESTRIPDIANHH